MSERYKTQRLHLLNTWEKCVVMLGYVEGRVITELFGQAGPRGSVRIAVGGCRSSTEWFLSQRRLSCHVSVPQHALGYRPSSPSGDLVALLSATLLCFSNKNVGENVSQLLKAFRTTSTSSCVLAPAV